MKKICKDKFIIEKPLTIIEAMKKMDENGYGILFFVDINGKLKASLSDGDIRRWLIRTGNLATDIQLVMNTNPKYIFTDFSGDVNEFMAKHRITAVPVVDIYMHVLNIIINRSSDDNSSLISNNALEGIDVIIMAGGKGTRLYPYTKILPKPLVPIGDVPILERIFNRFHKYGINRFYLTVNYKKEMIKAYFADVHPPYEIIYVEEDKPLGTAGSIQLIDKKFDKPVIVTNCDTLIETDYNKIVAHHKRFHNDITIVSSLKNTTIPYGVIYSDGKGIVTSMEEKPQLSNFINTGMYIINPEFLGWIPENEFFHMTHLVQKMMEKGKKVGMYPISENSFWDMGEFAEMKKMEERINSGDVN